MAYLEPEAYLKLCEMLNRHIQNPVIGHYLAILRALCSSCICKDLAYAESYNIDNPSIIAPQRTFRTHIYEKLQILRTLTSLKPDIYSEPSQSLIWCFLQK